MCYIPCVLYCRRAISHMCYIRVNGVHSPVRIGPFVSISSLVPLFESRVTLGSWFPHMTDTPWIFIWNRAVSREGFSEKKPLSKTWKPRLAGQSSMAAPTLMNIGSYSRFKLGHTEDPQISTLSISNHCTSTMIWGERNMFSPIWKLCCAVLMFLDGLIVWNIGLVWSAFHCHCEW